MEIPKLDIYVNSNRNLVNAQLFERFFSWKRGILPIFSAICGKSIITGVCVHYNYFAKLSWNQLCFFLIKQRILKQYYF